MVGASPALALSAMFQPRHCRAPPRQSRRVLSTSSSTPANRPVHWIRRPKLDLGPIRRWSVTQRTEPPCKRRWQGDSVPRRCERGWVWAPNQVWGDGPGGASGWRRGGALALFTARYPRAHHRHTRALPRVSQRQRSRRTERPCERALVGSSGLWCCERGWVWAPNQVWGDGSWGASGWRRDGAMVLVTARYPRQARV